MLYLVKQAYDWAQNYQNTPCCQILKWPLKMVVMHLLGIDYFISKRAMLHAHCTHRSKFRCNSYNHSTNDLLYHIFWRFIAADGTSLALLNNQVIFFHRKQQCGQAWIHKTNQLKFCTKMLLLLVSCHVDSITWTKTILLQRFLTKPQIVVQIYGW